MKKENLCKNPSTLIPCSTLIHTLYFCTFFTSMFVPIYAKGRSMLSARHSPHSHTRKTNPSSRGFSKGFDCGVFSLLTLSHFLMWFWKTQTSSPSRILQTVAKPGYASMFFLVAPLFVEFQQFLRFVMAWQERSKDLHSLLIFSSTYDDVRCSEIIKNVT